MNADNVLVSVICDVYNHEPYLRDCLEGFINQKTNFTYEILIHDDASTDNSVNIIREYVNKYPHLFKPIFQTENQYSKGMSIWYDIQIPRAKGKYIAICEGDDYWIDPYKLQKQVDILEADETLMACVTNSMVVSNTKEVLSKYTENIVKDNNEGRYNLRDFMRVTHNYPTASVLYCRKEVDRVRKYCNITRNPFFGDWNLWIALHIIGDFYYMDEVTTAYRINPNSVTHSNVDKRRLGLAKANFEIIKKVQSILPPEYNDIRKELDKTAWIWYNLANAYKHSGKYLHMIGCLICCEFKEPGFVWKKIICRR